jgi:hypothetical protein
MNLLNSFLLDCCPLATALTNIPASTCPENMGQIQRYWFVRRGEVIFDVATPANNLPAAIAGVGNFPSVLAPWTILFALATSEHVVTSPLIGGDSVIEAGSVVSQGGGDNSTLSGSTLINGINPATGKARFDSLTGAQIAAMRLLVCEGANMEVYMINQQGLIWGQRVGDLFTGFDCENVVIETMTNNGFGTRDNNMLTFQLPYDYDETKGSITPTDFNALTV